MCVRAADKFDSVYITEFLADNQHSLQDDDSQRSGWIELYNGGNAPVNLLLGKKDTLDFGPVIVVHALTNRSARPYLKTRFAKSFW